jgi:hypothetical protein
MKSILTNSAMNFLKRLFYRSSQQKEAPLPPMPSNWNLTISDLMKEMEQGKRKSVGSPELDWAKEYERGLLPDDTRFPKMGDVYSPLHDMTVTYMTAWAAPYTGGGDGLLLQGEKVVVSSEPVGDRPVGIYLKPLDYDAVEQRMVPELERTDSTYRGFYLMIETIALINDFELSESSS